MIALLFIVVGVFLFLIGILSFGLAANGHSIYKAEKKDLLLPKEVFVDVLSLIPTDLSENQEEKLKRFMEYEKNYEAKQLK